MMLAVKKQNSTIHRRRIRVRDISISYLFKGSTENSVESGNRTGTPPILFIHGFPFNKNMWLEQLEALPDGQVGIAVDVRGHGNSTIGQGFFSIHLFVQDLIHFLDKIKIDKVILCGVSMGGYIALQMMKEAPERISGLILSDTNCYTDDNPGKIKRFETIQSILKHGNRTFAITFSQKLFTPKSLSAKHPGIERIMRSIRRNNIRSICATLLALASRLDTTDLLEHIHIPTWILYGEQDSITPKEQSVFMHDRIPGSKLIEIEDAGHLPNIENPEVFNQILQDYLKLPAF